MKQLGTLSLSNNLFLAPMAGITDTIFRVIAKRYGCGLCFSEMISSNGILKGGVSCHTSGYRRKINIHPDEQPAGIQIVGDDPRIMAKAAIVAEEAGAKIININMGCPSREITKNQSGCALMKEPLLARNIIREVKKVISVPLSIKMRLGWDEKNKNYLEIGKIAEEEGCAAVIMHARTRAQKFRGKARWEEIKRLKDSLRISVIGNGDVTSYEKAQEAIQLTGCDGVMIGRGALGQPWIFTPNYLPTLLEKKELMLEHLEKSLEYYGEVLGLRLMRKHFGWYSHGIPNSANFRKNIFQCPTPESAKNYIEEFFLTNLKSVYAF